MNSRSLIPIKTSRPSERDTQKRAKINCVPDVAFFLDRRFSARPLVVLARLSLREARVSVKNDLFC